MATKDPLNRILYSDIDMDFNLIDGDLQLLENEDAVRQAVINISLTARTEKKFDPTYGTIIPFLLFGLHSDIGMNFRMERQIYFAILNREPRITNLRVQVYERPDSHTLIANIIYTIVGKNFTDNVTIDLQRVR